MRLTWKDGLATVFVGAAVLLYLLSPSDISLFGLLARRAPTRPRHAVGTCRDHQAWGLQRGTGTGLCGTRL